MRNSWTDDRLDDFRAETQQRFDEVYRRFDDVDRRIDEVNKRIDSVERRMESSFSELTARFDALQHLMFRASVGVILALIGILVTQL